MTKLCSDLYRDPNHEGWNDYDLATLPKRELVFLCRIMGIPTYGNAETITIRLLTCRIVRKELSPFGDDPAAVVPVFKRSRLHWMCQQAKLWKSGNKYSLSVVLLRWRNECRHKGQAFLNECIEATKASDQQLTLKL